MDPVTGAAAHPSMQRKTDAELRDRLTSACGQLSECLIFPPSETRDELETSLRQTIAAVTLALEWRTP
jgi:hypothetical protein